MLRKELAKLGEGWSSRRAPLSNCGSFASLPSLCILSPFRGEGTKVLLLHPERNLRVILQALDQRLAPNVDRSTVFVADWSGDRLALGENRLGLGLKRFEKR